MEQIGRGGMGEVWEAHDLESRAFVAVKLLLAEVGDEEAVARFRREARIGSRIRHPGVVPVYDAGQDTAQPFIVMELLEGSDLAALLVRTSGGLPLHEAVDLALKVSEVFAAAHEDGVVHRDLKPQNLFREADGRVRICDFGIARTADLTTRLTATGLAIGTPAYMAPEQWRGSQIDARCDLYAFGCVLYTLLTGSPPFTRVSPALALELVEAAESRMWELESDLAGFMAALRSVLLCWDTLAPRRVSRLVAAAMERFGHIECVARKISELPGRFDLNRKMAAVRRRPPGKEADQAWASLLL
ncbi:serine/threonine-protein kinase [Streptomyces ureilyticus]|uniref:non-specific serine/threonine protein kinase n=1 Tax=Streptomyces ureilyticus TaxID=1775131 RepID=A0ABX0E1H2_9ACTN|nr:serine/threonine-protein kinase [Streptomyces ureilyticus]NGO47295.1 serine/threonine protein kinase [Streptomyces ureilyticus]